ncbi:MAG: alpha/beta hydrolase [Verrucomicrobia bacterium]|nr:alpha/beta hydrolase [Cytophagales bacterium]
MKIPFKKIFSFFLLFLIGFILAYFIIYFNQETKILSEETRKEAPGKFIKLSVGTTHYEFTGADTAQTLVMIHGGGSGYFCFDNNIKDLQQAGFRILRYDLYGRGYSDRLPVDYSPELFHTQLTELLAALKIDKPVSLLGMSMGAIIAINFTDQFPEKVQKLILVDPAAINPFVPALPLRLPVVADVLMTVYWYPRAINKQMSEYYKPENLPEYAEKLSPQMKFKGFKHAILSTWKHTMSRTMETEIKRIGTNQRPVLLIWGDHDPLVPVTASEKYLQAMPKATLQVIKDAGHVSCYERPDLVNPILIDFLQK